MITALMIVWLVSIPMRLYTAYRTAQPWRYHVLTLWLILTALHSAWAIYAKQGRTGDWAFFYFVLTLESFLLMAAHFNRAVPLVVAMLCVFGSFSALATIASAALFGHAWPLDADSRLVIVRHYTLFCFLFLGLSALVFGWLQDRDGIQMRANSCRHTFGLMVLLFGQWLGIELVDAGRRFDDRDGIVVGAWLMQGTSFVAYGIWSRIDFRGEGWERPAAGRWDLTRDALRRALGSIKERGRARWALPC